MIGDDLHLLRHRITPDVVVDIVDLLILLDRGAEGQPISLVLDGIPERTAPIRPHIAELLIDFLGLLATKHDATTFVLDRTTTLQSDQVGMLLGHKRLSLEQMSGSLKNVSWDKSYRTTAAEVIDLVESRAVSRSSKR